MSDPPSARGATHARVIERSPLVVERSAGAPGRSTLLRRPESVSSLEEATVSSVVAITDTR